MTFALTRRAVLAGAAAIVALNPTVARQAAPQLAPVLSRGVPRRSDVCFSSRAARPTTLQSAAAFHANRLDWCYTQDAAFIASARQAGLATIGGAIHPTLSAAAVAKFPSIGIVLNRAGEPVTRPGGDGSDRWGCVNSPGFQSNYISRAKAALAAGVDWFQMDDPGMNAETISWGGCYCTYCRAKAAAQGLDLDRNMATFQRDSVTRFYAAFRQEIDLAAGRHVVMASNNTDQTVAGHWAWPYNLFEFGMAEYGYGDPLTPDFIAGVLGTAERMGRTQVLTLLSRDVATNRRVAACCYAQGGHLIAPWDVFMDDANGRFYGNPQDYASLYAFARSLGPLLDDAEGGGEPRGYAIRRSGTQASLRRDRHDRFALLHLVAWGDQGAAPLQIDAGSLVPGRSIDRARIFTPDGAPIPMAINGRQISGMVPPGVWAVAHLEFA